MALSNSNDAPPYVGSILWTHLIVLLKTLQARMQRLEQQLANSTANQDIYASPFAQKEDARSTQEWDKAGRR